MILYWSSDAAAAILRSQVGFSLELSHNTLW